ncbi:hypothetical protein V6N13_059313 [Hibiscus sabdariffa]
MEAVGNRFEVPVQVSQDQNQNEDNQNVSAKVSYASKVRNSGSGVGNTQDGLDIDPNRVVVLDEDCAKDIDVGNSPPVSVEPDKSSGAAGNSDTLFGPWMVVDTRRRHQQPSSTINKHSAVSSLQSISSRFMVLEPESIQQLPLILPEGEGDVQRTVADVDASPPGVVLNVAYRASNPDKKLKSTRLWLVWWMVIRPHW